MGPTREHDHSFVYALMEDRLRKMLKHLETAESTPLKERTDPALIRGEFTEIDRLFREFLMLRDTYLLLRDIRPQ